MSAHGVRVLVASETQATHSTVERALALLPPETASRIDLAHAHTAQEALDRAADMQPDIVYLDVTIGHGAGIGLVHFLQQGTRPGLAVVALVPESARRDPRLADQAIALGADPIVFGELTGDDVLRTFSKVAPIPAATLEPARSAARSPAPTSNGPALDEADSAAIRSASSFAMLQATLAATRAQLDEGDGRVALIDDVRAAIDACLQRERAERSPMQDPTTSAYSFGYFVDLAGREIDLARRHGRRFALATVEIDSTLGGRFDARSTIELVLSCVRDTDVVARADERELLLLLPETGSKGARTLRKRMFERIAGQMRMSSMPQGSPPLKIGIAGFPVDGEDLSRLLRIARRRAERWGRFDSPSRVAEIHRDAVAWLADPSASDAAVERHGLKPIDVPLREAWALLDTLVRESTRAGDATIALHAPGGGADSVVGLAHGIRASALEAMGPTSTATPSMSAPPGARTTARDALSLITGTSTLAENAGFDGFEALAILAEHASYALLGRVDDGRLRALQSHDLPFAEALVVGLEQPMLRRGPILSSAHSSAAPSMSRISSRNERSEAPGA